MRLIDADALLERMKNDPLFPIVERYGLSGVIENEPTVDAIPVDFIYKEAQTAENMMIDCHGLHSQIAYEYAMLIKHWDKENETSKVR